MRGRPRRPRRRRRDGLAAVVGRGRRRPPLLRAGHRPRPLGAAEPSRRRDAERRLRPRRRGGGDRSRSVGVQRPGLLRGRDGGPHAWRCCCRSFAESSSSIAACATGRWDHRAAGRLGRLADVRLGIVGFGRIGRAVAARAARLGDGGRRHSIRSSRARRHRVAGARPASLDELLRSSTAVSLHAPLTPDTQRPHRRRASSRCCPKAPSSSTSHGLGSSTRRRSSTRSRAVTSAESRSTCSTSSRPTPPSPHRRRRGSSSIRTRAGTARRPKRRAPRRATESVREVLEGRVPRHCGQRGSVERPVSARPHILLFVVDQLAAPYLRAHGHTVTKTPTIDELAGHGRRVRERLHAEPAVRARAGSPHDRHAPDPDGRLRQLGGVRVVDPRVHALPEARGLSDVPEREDALRRPRPAPRVRGAPHDRRLSRATSVGRPTGASGASGSTGGTTT